MHTMGWKTWRHGDPRRSTVCSDDLARINMIYHFYAPCYVEYSLINKMAKYDWNTFRNYVAFLVGGVAPGTRRPHHDSELISWYHEAFRTWGHYHNNNVLFYHDSPITRSHFMDPTDRAIKGFYCIWQTFSQNVVDIIIYFVTGNWFQYNFLRAYNRLLTQRVSYGHHWHLGSIIHFLLHLIFWIFQDLHLVVVNLFQETKKCCCICYHFSYTLPWYFFFFFFNFWRKKNGCIASLRPEQNGWCRLEWKYLKCYEI